MKRMGRLLSEEKVWEEREKFAILPSSELGFVGMPSHEWVSPDCHYEMVSTRSNAFPSPKGLNPDPLLPKFALFLPRIHAGD